MATELFQNLITSTIQTTQTQNQQTGLNTVEFENTQKDFGKALDGAKSKYISKDNVQLSERNNTRLKQEESCSVTARPSNSKEETTLSAKNIVKAQNESSQKNTNTNTTNSLQQETTTNQSPQQKTDDTFNSANNNFESTQNNSNQDTLKIDHAETEQTSGTVDQLLPVETAITAESLVNITIDVNKNTNCDDRQTTNENETEELSQKEAIEICPQELTKAAPKEETKNESEENSNKESDTLDNSDSKKQPETGNKNTLESTSLNTITGIETTSQTEIKLEPEAEQEAQVIVPAENTANTDSPATKNESIVSQKTAVGLDTKITDPQTVTNSEPKVNTQEQNSATTKEINRLASTEKQNQSESIEIQEQTDVLVSFDGIEEDIIAKNSDLIEDTTKISQETIDDMDVTIRSVDTYRAPSQNNNSANNGFTGSKNAAEDIIKMSIEKTNTGEQPEFSFDTATEAQTIQPLAPEANSINKITELPSNISSQNINGTTLTQNQEISDAEIISQISSKLQPSADNATSKVNIILQPESLGKVSVEILQTKDGVVAKFMAETPQVKELLDKSIETLKNSISSHGVNVSNITVKVEQSANSQNAGFGFEQEEFHHEFSKNFNSSKDRNESNSEQAQNENSTKSDKESLSQTAPTEHTDGSGTSKESISDNSTISIRV